MSYLYDMHCHILPGIDDGAKDEYEMMKMVRVAYNEGIRTIVTTPHYHPVRGSADAETVMRIFAKMYSLIRHYYPDMDVYEGCEIYYQGGIVEKLKSGELLTLAGSNYALVEFSTDTEIKTICDAVNEFMFAGFYPVIAHVERYDKLIKDIDMIEQLVESGVYIQVNAGSVIGEYTSAAKKDIKKLLQRNLVHFVGTDAHNEKVRPPKISKCYRYINKKFGEETADKIFHENPRMVIQNKII